MNANPIKLDVREDILSGGDPFAKIMKAVAALEPGADLLLLTPFEPVPLFLVLERQGLTHESKPLPTGDWEVRFTRTPGSNRRQPCPEGFKSGEAQITLENNNPTQIGVPNRSHEIAPVTTIELDARGLEPPQPLITILEALTTLPDNSALHARTDRRPMHLYPQLEARGFRGTTEEQADGTFITKIQR